MASTVDSIIIKFRRTYPDCDATRALEIFQDVHREICTRTEVRNSTVTVSLTAGTAEYDLAESVVKIHEAYYERSADDRYDLVARSLDEYRVQRRGWRSGSSTSDPTEFYTTSAVDSDSAKPQVGFYPTPGTSTSGTYPRVKLYVTSVAALSGSETVPTNLLNDNVYLAGMKYYYCLDVNPQMAQFWYQQFEQEIGKLLLHVQNMAEQAKTKIGPRIRGARVV